MVPYVLNFPMPRLIFVNRFFHPDHSATSQIPGDRAIHMAEAGLAAQVGISRLGTMLGLNDAPAYAVIGGVAMQLYTEEPRTTADLDIALRSHDDLPREKLEAAGFSFQLATMPDLILLKLEAAEEPRYCSTTE
jgi:hypothetical protein